MSGLFDYGLGLYTRMTPYGRIWGNDGNAPGYETVAWNNRSGRRGFVSASPRKPDDSIEAAMDAAVTAAACRILARSLAAS